MASMISAAGAFAAEPITKSYDVPAGAADKALKQFSEQSGLEVIFTTKVSRDVTTNAVKGEMTAREALNAIVAGTPLVVIQEPKSGAFTVRRESPAEAKNDSSRPAGSRTARSEDGVLKLDNYEVTGSRIRPLAGEQAVQPMLIVTSREIERFGVSSLSEVFQRIPQVSSYSTGQVLQLSFINGPAPINSRSSRVTATLRGSPGDGTLLLINGRRAPKNGQQSGSAYDLSGIPLASIERVEVLLDGASAVYGADAEGGVINVILKKDYHRTTVTFGYDNTFSRDAGIKTASISSGFAGGKLSGMLTVSRSDANSMMWRDRSFLSSLDRRPFGGSDFRSGVGGAGRIQSQSGNLPGLSTNIAAIPAGSNGVNVTVADYQNSGVAPTLDAAQYAEYSSAYRREGVVGNLEYRFHRGLSVFLEGFWGRNHTFSTPLPVTASNIIVPAGAPGNPFGVPVLMTKRFYDIAPDRHATVTNRNLTLGARGEFLADWRYESTLGQTQTEPLLNTSFGTSLTAAKVAAAFANPDPARGPVLLYDSQRGPANAAGTIESLLGAPTLGAERNQTWTYDAKADGSAWDLPAGPVRIALGAEYREEYVDFPLQPAATSTARNRYTSGYFVETRVPLLSARQNWSWMYKLEATVALRHDRYSDFAATTNPRYGLLFQPVKSLILRGSYSEGYKVPTLSELYSPLDSFDVTFTPGSALDSLRGNQPIVGFVTVNSRGNSSLQPERSQSYTCGAVWDVPIIKGLSLALNFYDTRYRDRIDSISVTDRIVLFPSTVIRGPNLPGDQPGWAGPVTGYNDLPQNIATQRIAGYDLGVKYNRASSWGEVAVTATASRTTKNEIHSVPYLPPTITSTPDALPLQIVSSAFLTRGSWETGVIFSHRARNRTNTLPTTYFTPAVQRWDWQGSYNFGKARDTSDDHRSARDWVFADLRLSVTIFNVLNTRPPMAFTGLPDNTLVDSRLRRYALNLTKSF